MALLDDLKGILSPEDFAKIQSNAAVSSRIAKGDELYGYYVGDEPPAVTPPATVDPPVARTTPPAGMFDLGAIERMLDTKLGAINTTIDSKVAEIVKQRGDELYNNVRAGVRTDALQLVKIYTRHQEATGKSWDDAEEVKFNDFLKANNEAVKVGGGKSYKNLTEAYNDYIAPTVTDREVERRVAEGVRAKSGTVPVPGTTSAPATNNNIRFFQKRGTAAEGGGQTNAQKAAELLDRRAAARQAEAS